MNVIDWSIEVDYFSYFLIRKEGEIVHSLPCGHSRYFPLSFHLRNNEIITGERNFYNKILLDNYSENLIFEFEFPLNFESLNTKVVFINLIDNCYGHSVLKLFQLTNFSFETSQFDYFVLIPDSIFHFFKLRRKGINFLRVKGGFKDFESLGSLKGLFNCLCQIYSDIKILLTTTFPVCKRENLFSFLGIDFNNLVRAKKYITFYYRKDSSRMWHSLRQHKCITKSFQQLRLFFTSEIEFVVLGDRDRNVFPDWIRDDRVSVFSADSDFRNVEIFSNSILTIGLTGSHMIFPSILSDTTVHLIQSYKLRNMAEDIVAMKTENSTLDSYRHLFYYGNFNCSDISPSKLATNILFHLIGKFEKEYRYLEIEQGQENYMKNKYPFFKYKLAREFREKYNAIELRKIRMLRYFSRLF